MIVSFSVVRLPPRSLLVNSHVYMILCVPFVSVSQQSSHKNLLDAFIFYTLVTGISVKLNDI